MLKSFFHWKVWANIAIVATIFAGLVWLTFRWLEYHTNHGEEIPVPNVMNMTIQNATKILDDTGLDYKVDSFQYDPKYKPFQVIGIYPKPGSRVKNGRTVQVRVNPRTWAKVQVPDIIDRYKGLAFTQLQRVGLQVGDTLYEPNIQRDAVIRMMYKGNVIKAGAKVPRFSVIDLVIGTGPMRNISVPNLVGLTVAEAKEQITNNLFEIGLIDFEDGGNDDSDIIYYQDPASGDRRDQGMQIDIWASKKTSAELQSKISYLNSIYRMKIDTTLPPVRYEEVPSYAPEPTEPAPNPIPREEPVQRTETPKPVTPKPVTPTPEKTPKNSGNVTGNTTATTPSEKPKVKKTVE